VQISFTMPHYLAADFKSSFPVTRVGDAVRLTIVISRRILQIRRKYICRKRLQTENLFRFPFRFKTRLFRCMSMSCFAL